MGIGCVMMIAAIFLIPLLIQLIEVLLVVAVAGGVGYLILKVLKYDEKTGNVTYKIEKALDLPISDPAKKRYLDGPLESDADDTLNLERNLQEEQQREEFREIKKEIEDLKNGRDQDIKAALSIYGEEIKKQKTKEVVEDIFSEPVEEGYSEADIYEERQWLETFKKKNDELEIRELKQEVAEELLEQRSDILEHKYETKYEFMSVRQEMAEGFMLIKENLQLLAQDMMTFKTYVSEKFSALELAFHKELSSLREMIIQVHTEFKQETADMKLKFGKEILRIDKQQLTLIDKMRAYEHKVKAFGLEIIRVKMDAEKFSMRGQEMLAKAQLAQQQHKLQTQQLSKDIDLSLQRIALKEQGFANTVGAAKLKMDEVSNQQYLALKDMAFERIGINALREDYQHRVSLEQERFNRLNDQQRNLLNQIKTEQAHGREVSGLQHRLYITQENLNHSRNNLNLSKQEIAAVRRLSK